jgi:hypothetical protein
MLRSLPALLSLKADGRGETHNRADCHTDTDVAVHQILTRCSPPTPPSPHAHDDARLPNRLPPEPPSPRTLCPFTSTFSKNTRKTDHSAGVVGCLLGHLRAIKLAYDSSAETVLIVEDDASPLMFPYWDMPLETFAEQLPQDWQAAQVGYRHTDVAVPQILTLPPPPSPPCTR